VNNQRKIKGRLSSELVREGERKGEGVRKKEKI